MWGCRSTALVLLPVMAFGAQDPWPHQEFVDSVLKGGRQLQAETCANEPMGCQPKFACPATTSSCICSPDPTMPGGLSAGCNNGICVAASSGSTECWDVCNPANPPTGFAGVGATPDQQTAWASMVTDHRRTCPGMETLTECSPGERCTPPTATYMSGMCVLGATGTSYVCLSMCDTAIPIEAYKTPGKAEGTVATIQAVRAGNDPQGYTTCPGFTVWIWLWVPILLCCCVCCCAGAYQGYKFYQTRLKRGRRGGYDADDMGKKDITGAFLEEPYDGAYAQVDQEPMPVVDSPAVPEMLEEQAVPLTAAVPLTTELPPTYAAAPMTMPLAPSMYSQPALQPGMASMSYPYGSHVTQMPMYGGYGAPASMRIG